MKGNEQGIQKAEGIVARWLAQTGIDPSTVTVEYIFYGGPSAVFGLSTISWEKRHGYGNEGRMTAWLSARSHGLRASQCNLHGAMVTRNGRDRVVGVLAFGEKAGRYMTAKEFVQEALCLLCDTYVLDTTGTMLGHIAECHWQGSTLVINKVEEVMVEVMTG